MVGGDAVHPACGRCHPAKDVTPADHAGRLNSERVDFLELLRHFGGDFGIDPERLIAHQDLTGQFDENALEGRHIADRLLRHQSMLWGPIARAARAALRLRAPFDEPGEY